MRRSIITAFDEDNLPILRNELRRIWDAIESVEKAQTPIEEVLDTTPSTIIEAAQEIQGEEEIPEEDEKTAPSMSGYSPSVSKTWKGLRVSWSDWYAYGSEEVLYYKIYCSTEATCTITDENLVATQVKSSPYTITGLSWKMTYDVRIVPISTLGEGGASS